MARSPKPWYRADRDAWLVTIYGARHCLGADKKKADARFHQLMANPERQQVAGDALVSLFDIYLAWCQQHRPDPTYRWYKRYLQAFIETIPASLTMDQLRPFHVQRWLDSKAGQSENTTRGRITVVKRAMNWARQQGYTTANPLESLHKLEGGRREVVIAPDEFQRIMGLVSDEAFQDVLTAAWETGARPQELSIVATTRSHSRCGLHRP